MATYILLTTLTPQGLSSLKAAPERLLEVNRELEAMGAHVVKQWALLGSYDFLSVVEADDRAHILEAAASLAARGSASVETLPAIPIDEFLESIRRDGP
jgi:uncharacterized protein with GYD domain